MYYRYENTPLECNIKENLMFSLKKIKKLYPLHILTMCFMIVLYLAGHLYNGITIRNVIYLLGTTVLNIFLVQTWVPYRDINVSLNGVAWYLSVTMFLYFMFPYIKKWIQNKKRNILYFICILIIFIEIIICIPVVNFMGTDSPVYIWFMYCFPIFRVGDFFIGCCLGKYYIESKADESNVNFTRSSIYEIMATLITISVYIWMKQNYKNSILLATQNFTTMYILLAVIWVHLFRKCNGVITKLLTNKITIFIGNISAYAFLIHYVIIQYFIAIKKTLKVELLNYQNALLIIIEFLVTILASVLYSKITKKHNTLGSK